VNSGRATLGQAEWRVSQAFRCYVPRSALRRPAVHEKLHNALPNRAAATKGSSLGRPGIAVISS